MGIYDKNNIFSKNDLHLEILCLSFDFKSVMESKRKNIVLSKNEAAVNSTASANFMLSVENLSLDILLLGIIGLIINLISIIILILG